MKINFSILLATALLLTTASTVSAAQADIMGNGAKSDNVLKLMTTKLNLVSQSNTTSVNNVVVVGANTGNNSIDDTTGGDSVIQTGEVEQKISIGNELNSNVAEVEGCGCESDVDAAIKENGANSDSKIVVDQDSASILTQTNVADVTNIVASAANTGDNEIDDTTGGDVAIVSGDVDVDIDLTTTANGNVGSLSQSGDGSDVDVTISENGVKSDNEIKVKIDTVAGIVQANQTGIDNVVGSDAQTGGNEIDDTTGGSAGIQSGDIEVDVKVENTAGFNEAELDGCDCATSDIEVDIAMNGANSDNKVVAHEANVSMATQTNTCGGYFNFLKAFKLLGGKCFDNTIGVGADTGDNDIKDTTTGSNLLLTGKTKLQVKLSNLGGFNLLSK